MILRGTLRVLIRKLAKKIRLFVDPAFIPLAVPPLAAFLFLLAMGIFFNIPEALGDAGPDFSPPTPDEMLVDIDEETEQWPGWERPNPQRWFRSNAGGMALEETPSRLAALRNQYALVIDYLPLQGLEPRLERFYQDEYIIEIRVLYKQKEEVSRQWVFRDEQGITRLNAVFKRLKEEPEALPEEDTTEDTDDLDLELEFAEAELDIIDEFFEAETESDDSSLASAESDTAESDITESDIIDEIDEIASDEPEQPLVLADWEPGTSVGFIELYNKNAQITNDYWLFQDGGEIAIGYFYNGSTLVKAETQQKFPAANEYRLMYTDNFRYNRSFALRSVERIYHSSATADPVSMAFPYRVLDAAADTNFMSDKLFLGSDFFDNFFVAENYRMLYDTDSRGRILTQTLVDDQDEVIWIIRNTWSGDRILATVKTEGEDEKRTEYEYDGGGNRIVQRDINNGVLERLVRIEGDNETEELYLNGVVVLRAYWENGRKTHEERVRR